MGRRKAKSRPSFFKVIVKDLTTHLGLPPVFVQKYGEILPKNSKLRISSGVSWNVELEEHCFSRGWAKFSSDVGLKTGEFLVFSLDIGKSTFDVSVYEPSGCERQISLRNDRVVGSDSDEDNHVMILRKDVTCITHNSNAPVAIDGVGKHGHTSEEPHPQFKVVLNQHHTSRVSVHKPFALGAGLMSKTQVVLQYPPNQRYWPVLLDHDFPKLSWFRLDMTKGWPEFRKENGLAFGKTYLFEYIPDKNVIEVKLLTS